MHYKSRRLILCCYIILTILTFLSFSFTGCEEPIKTYENKEYNFRITYPDSWTIDPESDPTVIAFYPKNNPYICAAFTIKEDDENLSIEEYAKDIFNTYVVDLLTDIENYREGNNAPDPWQWYQSYDGYESSNEISVVQYYKLDSGLVYMFILQWDKNKTNELKSDGTYYELFDIAKSFRLIDE